MMGSEERNIRKNIIISLTDNFGFETLKLGHLGSSRDSETFKYSNLETLETLKNPEAPKNAEKLEEREKPGTLRP